MLGNGSMYILGRGQAEGREEAHSSPHHNRQWLSGSLSCMAVTSREDQAITQRDPNRVVK